MIVCGRFVSGFLVNFSSAPGAWSSRQIASTSYTKHDVFSRIQLPYARLSDFNVTTMYVLSSPVWYTMNVGVNAGRVFCPRDHNNHAHLLVWQWVDCFRKKKKTEKKSWWSGKNRRRIVNYPLSTWYTSSLDGYSRAMLENNDLGLCSNICWILFFFWLECTYSSCWFSRFVVMHVQALVRSVCFIRECVVYTYKAKPVWMVPAIGVRFVRYFF